MSEKVTELTNGILKELLTDAVVGRGTVCEDLDVAVKPGVYNVAPVSLNRPDAYPYGILIVFSFPNMLYTAHIYIPDGENPIYVRTIWNGSLRAWRKIAVELV